MPLNLAKPQPLEAAIAAVDRRTPVGTALTTAEIQRIPSRIRHRAQFSAGVESVRFMQEVQRRVQKAINLEFGSDRATFIADMQELGLSLGLKPGEDDSRRGTIQDPTTFRRLGLIIDVQTALAKGEAGWRAAMTAVRLRLFPCFELIRVEEREAPRDWPTRWEEAGGEFYGGGQENEGEGENEIISRGRMIAPKTSDIWRKISRFDRPWPIYDFNSGKGLREVRRRDAIDLGVIPPDFEQQPPGQLDEDGDDGGDVSADELAGAFGKSGAQLMRKDAMDEMLNHPLETLIGELDPRYVRSLESLFGDTVERSVDGKRLRLNERAVSEFVASAVEGRDDPREVLDLGRFTKLAKDLVEEAGLRVDEKFERFELRSRDILSALDARDAPGSFEEWDELPILLREPDEVRRVEIPTRAGRERIAETYDFRIRSGQVETWARIYFTLRAGRAIAGRVLGLFRRLITSTL